MLINPSSKLYKYILLNCTLTAKLLIMVNCMKNYYRRLLNDVINLLEQSEIDSMMIKYVLN